MTRKYQVECGELTKRQGSDCGVITYIEWIHIRRMRYKFLNEKKVVETRKRCQVQK